MAMPPSLARRRRAAAPFWPKKREQREKGGKKETKEAKCGANDDRPSMAPVKCHDDNNNNGGSDNNKRSATKKSLAWASKITARHEPRPAAARVHANKSTPPKKLRGTGINP
ncbi:hypothetical protein psal_cds_1410 [Pandoravirus salinus]|uniref:Uncharacterized protein n=1 Tax=Pandoravirus salinus TaxID=1349410 RepID=S4VYR5_9VIRU|nr:hypothetical protein psal_cds_1410 [Pandoravirus salinus]AGO85844.2 hypothetical protein psal_cds_1410 [Pandoravirus salinus]